MAQVKNRSERKRELEMFKERLKSMKDVVMSW